MTAAPAHSHYEIHHRHNNVFIEERRVFFFFLFLNIIAMFFHVYLKLLELLLSYLDRKKKTIFFILVLQSDFMAILTCADGKWNKQVSCEPVDCGRPDKYHVHPANFSFPEGTTYGKKCTFQCMHPAQLIGGFSTVDPD